MLKTFYILFCSLLFCLGAAAQNTDTGDTNNINWNLAQCISYAKQNNITLNTLRLDAKYDEQNVIASKAARTPNLTGSVTQGLTNYNSGLNSSSGYGVSSSVVLYNGGYLKNDIKSQQLSLQAANLNILAGENDITLSITQAYLNILLAKENVVYEKDVVATAEAQVKQGQQRYDAGTIANKDLLELQATLANDKYNLVASQNQVKQNILTLKQILQLPTGRNFNIDSTDTIQPVAPVAGLEEAEQTALGTRPEVKSSEISVQLQQAELEKAKYGLRPSLSLNGSLYSNYSSNALANNHKYFSQIGNNFYQGLGLTLNIPIIDRKVTKTNVARAKINIDQAKLNLQNTRTNLSQAVEQAYINVMNAQSQFVAAKEQLNYTQEAYRIANAQLTIGVYNIVDYLQQKNQYVQAIQAYTQAKYASILYTKIYNFYTGIPVTEQP